MRKMLLPLSKETEFLISLTKFHKQNKVMSQKNRKKFFFHVKNSLKIIFSRNENQSAVTNVAMAADPMFGNWAQKLLSLSLNVE